MKELDIGEIHQIEGYSGVTRTVTALITMIADINLKVKQQKENLIWFKNIVNHFVVEFSDNGAPDSREKTMTIGSLTLWNYGSRIRSREFHYPLHMISTTEKDIVCSDLWQQHADEMQLIESNVFTINEEKVTFEFQPSADQALPIIGKFSTHMKRSRWSKTARKLRVAKFGREGTICLL